MNATQRICATNHSSCGFRVHDSAAWHSGRGVQARRGKSGQLHNCSWQGRPLAADEHVDGLQTGRRALLLSWSTMAAAANIGALPASAAQARSRSSVYVNPTTLDPATSTTGA